MTKEERRRQAGLDIGIGFLIAGLIHLIDWGEFWQWLRQSVH
jgi:hypothetical protein